MPKVSVIIPNYNHAPYLGQRIETVLAQTFKDTEVLILDDCSTDRSREVITRYAETDSRIRVFFNDKNSGSTFKQWNKGVKLAQGDYLWIAESDDFSDLTFLERTVSVMESSYRQCLVFTNSHIVNTQGEVIDSYRHWMSTTHPHKWESDYLNDGKQETLDYLMYRNIIANVSSVLMKRSAYLNAGGAEESMRLCGDWLLYIKMLEQGDIAYLSSPLNYYRMHASTVRSKYFYSLEGFREMMQIFDYVMQAYHLKKEQLDKGKFLALGAIWLQSLSNAGNDLALIRKHFRFYPLLKELVAGFDRKIAGVYLGKIKSWLRPAVTFHNKKL